MARAWTGWAWCTLGPGRVSAQERPGQHTNILLGRGHDQVQCVEEMIRLAELAFRDDYSPRGPSAQ